MNKTDVLFISPTQFGYATDLYNYVKYLNCKKDINVKVICKYQHKKLIELPTNVISAYQFKGNNIITKFINYILFVLYILYYSLTYRPSKIFISYMMGFKPIVILLKKIGFYVIGDVRSVPIIDDYYTYNKKKDTIKKNLEICDEITTISNDVAKELKLQKFKIIPLGGDYRRDKKNKNTNYYDQVELSILYLGTLENRSIENFIRGFEKFQYELDDSERSKVVFNIVGKYEDDDKQLIFNKFIESLNKKNIHINYHGAKYTDQLDYFFENNQVGVSFIPQLDYYDLQPPTKTYEYLTNSLYCIATNTSSNREILNGLSEELYSIIKNYQDIVEIKQILKKIYLDRKKIKYNHLNNHNLKIVPKKYHWEHVVSDCLVPIIK
ncbi:hypothetical protein [Exiguobacterium sp. s7]|uniref:hypothetical protein n=1 Tax=Exiguobacterium sp. s7 TaxID=2751235 RepID=UPI001BE629AE|nr:hypothetical protein [Exiguobacterium sp. s7]